MEKLLSQIKSYIDNNNLYPAKVNVIDNFTLPLSVKEILDELEISKHGYYRALPISKDKNLELHLKREPNSCFANNYFDVGLKAWRANMDKQHVFNEYKTVSNIDTYMCQYFSKTEDRCSQTIKQAAREAFENNLYHHDTKKAITKAYLSNRECSIQEAIYHILSELKLRRIFPAVYFVNTNPREERIQVLLSEKELSELPYNSPNIFKKSNIDRYMERPNATFCNGKYSILANFCYAELLAYYTLENRPSKTGEYQPDELDDNLIENNHENCSYPQKIKLMISGETMRCRKVRRILRYHVPNRLLFPEKFAHYVMLLFFPFRDEKQLVSGCPPLYQNKLQEQGVPDVVNRNKRKFEPYGDLVDPAFSQLMRTQLTIKAHIAKLKMMKHQRQNIPIKMIQKTQKQAKRLQFLILCHKYYQMMKL